MSWALRALLGATWLVSVHGQAEVNVAIVNTTDNEPVNTQEVTFPPLPVEPLGGEAAQSYRTPAFLPPGEELDPKLSQFQTNGNSVLGTTGAPRLPQFLAGSPMAKSSFPWGARTAANTNYYQDVPNTGVTRHYNFTVSNMVIAPDGVEVEGVVINQQFPAPTITANWGDWIEVIVHNELDEGTSLHWHGLLQKETPWYDGVPGVVQCPIAPGSTFTYRFRADLYGTSWYHSHYSAQYAGGAFGPLIIYGPSDNIKYDEDLGPILLSDWYHMAWRDLVEQVMAPFAEGLPPPQSNNNLINGKMNYPCANSTGGKCTPNAGISKFQFKSGKTYRLRLINSGAEAIQKFSIDGHKLTVFANDFVPIKPYTTDVVTLGVGQRADVVVKATGKATDVVWMRSDLGPSAFGGGGCSIHDGVSPIGLAAIYYEKAKQSAVPKSNSTVSTAALTTCQNDPLSSTVPYYRLTPPSSPQTSQNIHITFGQNATHNLFFMNNSTFRTNFNDPVLLAAKHGRKTYPSQYNVYDFNQSRSIRLVLYNHALTGAHPMHMHGHNMYILQEGNGTWDGTIVNPSNPRRVDTHLLHNASPTTPSYTVVQIDADNPGVWPFHCHIAWHVSAGLYINILERKEDIQRDMPIPGVMAQTCRDWSEWTGENVVEEIDSGL